MHLIIIFSPKSHFQTSHSGYISTLCLLLNRARSFTHTLLGGTQIILWCSREKYTPVDSSIQALSSSLLALLGTVRRWNLDGVRTTLRAWPYFLFSLIPCVDGNKSGQISAPTAMLCPRFHTPRFTAVPHQEQEWREISDVPLRIKNPADPPHRFRKVLHQSACRWLYLVLASGSRRLARKQ